MAIKSKSSKWLVEIISILVITLISGWLYSNYEQMESIAKKQEGNIFEKDQFYERLVRYNYALYYDLLEQGNGDENLAPSDMFSLVYTSLDELFGEYDYDDEGDYFEYSKNVTSDQKYEYIQKQIMSKIQSQFNTYRSELVNMVNLKYLAIDTSHDPQLEYGDDYLKQLLSANLSSQEITELQAEYQYYVVLNYDSNGNLTVSNLYGLNFTSSQTGHSNANVTTATNNVLSQIQNHSLLGNDYKLNPIKNMTYIYAIPQDLVGSDYITLMQNSYSWWSLQSVVGTYSWIAVAAMGILALLLPINAFKQGRVINKLLNWPVESMLITFTLPIPLFVEFIPSLIQGTLDGSLLLTTDHLFAASYGSDSIVLGINLAVWILILGWVFLDLLYLKNLFKIGFKTVLKTQVLSINILKWILYKVKDAFYVFTAIDLKDKNTKKLAMLIGIQFVLISFMCLIFVFGMGIALVYCIGLFIVLRKKLIKVETDYAKLFEMTSQLADGNLDIKMDDDFGMFNSLKEELGNIQSGFKKAVDNEVKSQRMKTDLIANVSHDLKTPLTSIITYVDLLKDDAIDQEKRHQYLETLDQKSQRLKVLIEDLFEMSKASSENITMNQQEVDVVSLMKQTLLETEDKIEASALMIRRQFPDEKVMLLLDSERTFRVFENLILNMTKYAMPGTRGYIDILDHDETVQILFRNMSADEITVNVDELVERFVRGDQSRHTEGSGLGLAIAKSFVELQGGTFEVLIDGDLFKVIITFKK